MLSMDGHLDLTSLAAGRRPAMPSPRALAPAVIGTWRGRMINEFMSSFVFSSLADQMIEAGDLEGAERCREAAAEEREHGALCGAVVTEAGGEARAMVAPPRSVPKHADTTRLAAAARNVISVACMSETVAVALIGAERLEMEDGPLRELLTRIWSDEVGHARFGWTWLDRTLPKLSAAELTAIERYLPYAFGHLEAHELSHLPVESEPPEAGKAFGLCSGKDARTLFVETVEQVIVPELEKRGLRAARAWAERKVA
jgi:hypothetical protein